MAPIIGIDLGTTNSAVAVLEKGKPRMILNDTGSNITPSAVWEDPSGKVTFGSVAYRKAGAALRFKRLMGTDDPVTVGTRRMSPEECSGLILRKLVDDAERTLREKVDSAVVTVPANWKDGQRRATAAAGRLAGLNVERLINEPTAAAMAYGMRADADGQTIVVYDLGGGTFDITILRVHQRVFDVVTSSGDDELGGMDFDRKIVEFLMSKVAQKTGYRLPPLEGQDPKMRQRVRDLEIAAEDGKKELSFAQETVVSVPFLDLYNGEPLSVEEKLSRNDFDRLIEDDVRKTLQYMESALRAAKMRCEAIDEIVLVGGSTRIPLVRERIAEFFGKEPLTAAVNPDEAVALGAAIQGGIIAQEVVSEESFVALDALNNSLGVETLMMVNGQPVPHGFSKILAKGTKTPCQGTESYSTVHDNQETINIRCFEGEAPVTTMEGMEPVGEGIPVDGLPHRPAGEVKIDITFKKDINELLEVNWIVHGSEISGSHTITMRSGLHSDEEFDRKKAELDMMWSKGREEVLAAVVGSQPKQEEAWRSSPIAARFKALIDRADSVIAERRDIPDRANMVKVLTDLKQAVTDGDEETAEDLDLEVTDLLFDLE